MKTESNPFKGTREDQETLIEVNSDLLIKYVEKFIDQELMKITNWCWKWSGGKDISFNHLQPEDFVFKVLELINEGRRKCYTKSFIHFKNSVYYHVHNELLSFFKFGSSDSILEDDSINLVSLEDVEEFFESGEYVIGGEDILAEIEKEDIRENLLNLFDPNDEIEEISVLEEIFNNHKRADIAACLQLTVDDVTNIQKRIIRRLEKHNIKKILQGDI